TLEDENFIREMWPHILNNNVRRINFYDEYGNNNDILPWICQALKKCPDLLDFYLKKKIDNICEIRTLDLPIQNLKKSYQTGHIHFKLVEEINKMNSSQKKYK